MTDLDQRIADAVKSTKPGKQRIAALKAIRWRLANGDGQYVAVASGLKPILTRHPVLIGGKSVAARCRGWQRR